MELSVHVMPFKYQPFYGNVKWTKQKGVVAKQHIKAGEELFIDFNDFKDPDAFAIIYYNDLRKNDSSKDDYDEAKNKVISLKIERIKLYQSLMQVDFLAS